MRLRGTTPLETPRLRLRRFTEADAPAMFSTWASDPEVTRWMTWAPHKNQEETEAILAGWVKAYGNENYYHWAVEKKDDHTLIGSLGILLDANTHFPGEYAPGYCFARAYWGHGYATEALQAAIAAFHQAEPEVKRLYCIHAEANPASGRVMEHAGFHRLAGETTTFLTGDGQTVPAFVYRLDF